MEFRDFNYIYAEYKNKVTAYVRKKVADTSAVEDLVEDIFMKIYENLDRYDPEKSALSSWIYTVTSRMVTDYYRTRRVHSEIPSDDGAEGMMPLSLIESQELDADIIQAEMLDQLADALESLADRERDLIILHYYSNLTLKEIAVKMKMSYANVKIIHKKALSKMRGQFD